MPRRSSIFFGVVFVLGLACMSCQSSPITSPGVTNTPQMTGETENSARQLWYYGIVEIDPSNWSYTVTPVRNFAGHLNILSCSEQSPCGNCFKLKSAKPSGTGTVLAEIEIKHPFSSLNLTGFDVRGICMFDGTLSTGWTNLVTSDRAKGEGELVNADGFTALYSPATSGHGMESYTPGKLATPTQPSSTLNGFKRFVSNKSGNTRNAFYGGDTVDQTFEIAMPKAPHKFIFGYAVDACWAPPKNKPVTNPMTDFGPEANCPEAWQKRSRRTILGGKLMECYGRIRGWWFMFTIGREKMSHIILKRPLPACNAPMRHFSRTVTDSRHTKFMWRI